LSGHSSYFHPNLVIISILSIFVVETEFDNVVINITDILKANTVITGANIAFNMFSIEKFSSILSILSVSLKTFANIINGLAAITTQRNQILIKSTTAKAIKGKAIHKATQSLINKFHTFFPKELF